MPRGSGKKKAYVLEVGGPYTRIRLGETVVDTLTPVVLTDKERKRVEEEMGCKVVEKDLPEEPAKQEDKEGE